MLCERVVNSKYSMSFLCCTAESAALGESARLVASRINGSPGKPRECRHIHFLPPTALVLNPEQAPKLPAERKSPPLSTTTPPKVSVQAYWLVSVVYYLRI